MAKGYLVINVYGESIANPIKNAQVDILKDGRILSTMTTDENGRAGPITLETVDKSYSEEEQYETRPYETYDVTVESLGMTKTTIEDVQIFEEIQSIQNIYLTSLDTNEQEDISTVTPNTLWGDYPPNIWKEEDETDSGIAPIVLRKVVIPENIIVHDGVPNNSNATNDTVPFVDYIKNVASSEIYSTWPEETIRANVLAIISFTLNRIYTEWYPSRGYNFNITSSTIYDQKYTKNGTIFEPISRVVDDIFRNYLRSGVRIEPLLAHYKSNTNEEGYMSQWGSKELGDQGYSALEILRYYYGNNINIYEAEVTQESPYSFTKTLQEKDCGTDVYILQNALNYIRGSYPGIPAIPNPNGQFEEDTTSSVKVFQKAFSLPETGKVDYATWYQLSYILSAVTSMTNSIYSK